MALGKPVGRPHARVGALWAPVRVACLTATVALAWHERAVAASDPPTEITRPGSLATDGEYPDVYLNDSLEAVEVLAKAGEHVSRREWADAAIKLDHLCGRHGEKLFPTGKGEYQSVVSQVRRLLCALPAEGLDFYRDLVDAHAERALRRAERSKDLPALLRAFDRYFCSSSGPALGQSAAQLAIEAGHFRTAARVFELLAESHPRRESMAREWVAWQAVTDALAGDCRGARARLADHPAEARQATLPWMGTQRTVKDILDEIEQYAHESGPAAGRTAWPTFGGANDRNRAAEFLPNRVSQLWRFEDFEEGSPSMVALAERPFLGGPAHEVARLLGMHAIQANGLILIQDALRVWAIRADSGARAWTSAAPRQNSATYAVSDSGVAAWHAPTVYRGNVYASLGANLVPYYGHELPADQAALVCLHAGTGELVWRRDRSNTPAEFAEVTYDGSPIVVAGSLFAVERRRRAFGFEDSVLVGFDPDTGITRSRTHLGSASTGGFGYRRPTLSIVAADEDTVYVATNLGTITAVDAHTGLIRWLRVYTRDAKSDDTLERLAGTPPWRYTPVFVDGARLICMPVDVERVLLLNKITGRIVDELPTSTLCGAACLLGVQAGKLFGVGREVFAYDIDAKTFAWRARLPEECGLFGRGALTTSGLLIPTAHALCTYALADGRRSDQPWDRPGGGGNLLALEDRLIVAGSTHISVYADTAKIWGDLRKRMSAEPAAPRPALDLAEMLARNGDEAEATAMLSEAVRRAGGFAALRDCGLERRVFENCLTFACSLNRRSSGQTDVAPRMLRLYEMAAECPPDVEAQLRYRIPLAALYEQMARPDRAVHVLQQVVADPALNMLSYEHASADGAESAGQFCRARIDEMIRTHGRGIDEPFERKAASAVAAGRAARDPTILQRVADSYPNAAAAKTAHVYLGDLRSDAGEHGAAARAYYHAYAAYSAYHGLQAPQLVARIAESYRAAKRNDLARRWLEKGAREHPQAKIRTRGQTSPRAWSDLLSQLDLGPAAARPRRPRLSLPLVRKFERTFVDRPVLLAPPRDPRQTLSWRSCYIFADGGVTSCDPRTGETNWGRPVPCTAAPDLLAIRRDSVIFATSTEVFACAQTNGEVNWRVPADRQEGGAAAADHEDDRFYRYHAVGDPWLVSFRDDGQVRCTQLDDGTVRWMVQLDSTPTGPAAVGPGIIAFPARHLGSVSCCVMAATTGEVKATATLDGDVQIERTLISEDGRVVVCTALGLSVFDADTGTRIWRLEDLDGLRCGGVAMGLDGIYLATKAYQIAKLRLTDGGLMWLSEALPTNNEASARITVGGGLVLVSGDDFCVVLGGDDGKGVILPTLPTDARLAASWMTDGHMVLLARETAEDKPVAMLYAFELTRGLAGDAERVMLEPFGDLRRVVPCDDGIMIQDGARIVAWSSRR